jgi:hypothetical protein
LSRTPSLPRLNVRLPADVSAWVAQEAAHRHCALNTVVLDALNTKMTLILIEQANKKHDAAVKQAISVADLPRGTEIILQSAAPGMKTDILVKARADADYSMLARVLGEEVTFADGRVAHFADSGQGQSPNL